MAFLKEKHSRFLRSGATKGSYILRTRQTAKIAGEILGKKPVFDKRLREVNFGDFHGKPKKSYYSYFCCLKERFEKRPPNGESLNDVAHRLKSFLKEIEQKHKNKKILLISHGDTLRILEGIIRGTDLLSCFQGFYFKPGELKKLKKH